MDYTKSAVPVREAVGVFFDSNHLHAAIDELETSGFDVEQLGLLAGEFTVKDKLGDFYTAVNESANTEAGPQTAFVADRLLGKKLPR